MSEKSTTRAMVPVLLCFNVEHEEGINDEQFSERARTLIELNLGTIGMEEPTISISLMKDEAGADLDAAVYPSDYPWCDTMAHTRPDWETSKPVLESLPAAAASPQPCELPDASTLAASHDPATCWHCNNGGRI